MARKRWKRPETMATQISWTYCWVFSVLVRFLTDSVRSLNPCVGLLCCPPSWAFYVSASSSRSCGVVGVPVKASGNSNVDQICGTVWVVAWSRLREPVHFLTSQTSGLEHFAEDTRLILQRPYDWSTKRRCALVTWQEENKHNKIGGVDGLE